MSALKPGDVVKRRGDDGSPVGPAMCIEGHYSGIHSHTCWTCVWFIGGQVKRRAFFESVLVKVAIEPPSDTEAHA